MRTGTGTALSRRLAHALPRLAAFSVVAAFAVLSAGGLPAAAEAATPIQATETSSTQSLYGVACVSASTCFAVGADENDSPAVLTVTNGNPGAVSDFPDPNFEPAGIACAPGGQCIAVGNDVDADTGEEEGALAPVTNGQPGATQSVPSSGALLAIGCSSYSYCIAAAQDPSGNFGTVEISGGQPQTFTPISDPNFQSSSVACYASNKCIVGGESGLPPSSTGAFSLVTSGSPGPTVSTNNAIQLNAVACTGSGSCAGVGNVNGGNDSSGYPVPEPSITAISGGQFGSGWDYSQFSDGTMTAAACGSASTCLAIGGDDNGDLIAAPIVNGNAGQAAVLTTSASIGQIQLSDAACPSAGSCVAIGQDVYTNPVVAVVPVPAYQSQSPTTGGGNGGSAGKPSSGKPSSGKPSKKKKAPGARAFTRLTLAVTWPHSGSITRLTITAHMQNAATRGGIDGMRLVLQERAPGGRRWRAVASARTHRVAGVHGEARFAVPAYAGTRVQYRAVFHASRRYAGAVSAVKTLVILS